MLTAGSLPNSRSARGLPDLAWLLKILKYVLGGFFDFLCFQVVQICYLVRRFEWLDLFSSISFVSETRFSIFILLFIFFKKKIYLNLTDTRPAMVVC